jgi:hypothetical protein
MTRVLYADPDQMLSVCNEITALCDRLTLRYNRLNQASANVPHRRHPVVASALASTAPTLTGLSQSITKLRDLRETIRANAEQQRQTSMGYGTSAVALRRYPVMPHLRVPALGRPRGFVGRIRSGLPDGFQQVLALSGAVIRHGSRMIRTSRPLAGFADRAANLRHLRRSGWDYAGLAGAAAVLLGGDTWEAPGEASLVMVSMSEKSPRSLGS